MKKFIVFALIGLSVNLYAQKDTCETPEDAVEDLNSITKCTIKPSEKSKDKRARQISVRVSAPKRRFLKKRKKLVAGASNLSTSGLSSTNESTSISKTVALKTNLAALTNTLSKEEVRSAEKFSTVNDIPLFPSCKGEEGDDQLDCFNNAMMKHIQEHFRYPDDALVNKVQGEVWVRFIIDKDGNVTNIKALGPKGAKILNDEAIRVVSNLPKFIPGVKNGKPTSVKYGFPINFSLEDN
ncbi:energy transducer TonB [Tenacibaculum sp. MEBiC06402]|uniref:energy transducer TonB n=1 Tax=unclassified Tenacibaculum TaxID=2635139 RepID=UPI003B99D5A5